MKYLLNKNYLTYIVLIVMVISLPLYFGTHGSQWLIGAMMLLPLLSWFFFLDKQRRDQIQHLQNTINKLSISDIRRLSLNTRLSVKTLRNLNFARLTHTQITQLKHLLDSEVSHAY